MDASPAGCSTPPPWHIDAVGGRPHHHGGKTAPTASTNCGAVACRSSTRRLLPVRRPGSGVCQDIRPSNRRCAIRISTASAFLASLFLPTLNPTEPPWYGPVCPVVWEGRRREVSPYPDLPTHPSRCQLDPGLPRLAPPMKLVPFISQMAASPLAFCH